MIVAPSLEIEEKTQRLVELLDREGLGGVLLNAQHNFAWITGGASNAIDTSRENGAASIFVRRDGQRFLLANNIEARRLLDEELAGLLIEPVIFQWQDEKARSELVLELASELAPNEIVTDIPVNASARTIEPLIARCRYSLTLKEVERYRELGRDASEVFDDLVDKISPGITENEIAATLRAELARKQITSVVTLVAADERISQFRHPIPTDKCLEKMVMVVSCSKRRGQIVSMSRLISFGSVSEDLEEKTYAAAFVNSSLWHSTRAGATGSELYQVARQAYEVAGFGDEIDKHHQGGAAGYKTREWVAHPASTEVVQDKQAFAWNPSITGTKIEETVIAGPDGIEVLTASKLFPLIETEIDGTNYISPGILSA